MSALDLFTYEGRQVRTVIVDGEPWFVAADVAAILGYRDAHNLTRRLDEDEKGTQTVSTPGGPQSMTCINEPGIFAAILGSQVPDAKAFKRWLTHDVLPQIRRTGKYAGVEQIEYQIPQTYAAALELAWLQAKQLEENEARLIEQAPKVQAYEAFMDADGYYSMEQAAKVIGIGRNTLFRRLREDGVILHGGRTPTQRHAHRFKVVVSTYTTPDGEEHTSHTTKVRPESVEWLARRYGALARSEASP